MFAEWVLLSSVASHHLLVIIEFIPNVRSANGKCNGGEGAGAKAPV